MLGDKEVAATLAAKDLARAKEFYQNVLGLKINQEFDGGILFDSGKSQLFVYPSEFAGTNQATGAGWTADDVEDIASKLKQKGVKLEHYDMPSVKLEGDVHVMDGVKGIWFKDTEGNILSVSNGMG